MHKHIRSILLAGVAAVATWPAAAAEVTPERLINADKEPHNWLMNHRTYDAQRFSPLARINKDNVKNLKLAFAVAIGGTHGLVALLLQLGNELVLAARDRAEPREDGDVLLAS
jgi:glucose dehydrogenase